PAYPQSGHIMKIFVRRCRTCGAWAALITRQGQAPPTDRYHMRAYEARRRGASPKGPSALTLQPAQAHRHDLSATSNKAFPAHFASLRSYSEPRPCRMARGHARHDRDLRHDRSRLSFANVTMPVQGNQAKRRDGWRRSPGSHFSELASAELIWFGSSSSLA